MANHELSINVIKKDGTKDPFNVEKVISAITKSADRVMVKFTEAELNFVRDYVCEKAEEIGEDIPIITMHHIVETTLDKINPAVAKSYRDYRNYKTDFVAILDDVYKKSQSIMYIGDRDNSNTDSALVSTKRSLIYNELNKNLYKKFFLTTEELQACKDGYIYIHDMCARRDSINCCLFNAKEVLTGGFEMGNVWYTEPKSLDTAFDVLSDLILSAASQQYGGFTIPSVDELLAPYAKKSYDRYYAEKKQEIVDSLSIVDCDISTIPEDVIDKKCDDYATKKVIRDAEQGFQGIEYKLNTVSSSRGDYPFTTLTGGLGTGKFEKILMRAMLTVRKNGQGKEGHKKPVLFPKIVFLYDDKLHGDGGPLEDIFDLGVECSCTCMYPDWLSLTGEGYVAEMYKKYGKVVHPMGCRAFLSPWYERGGMTPADDDDKPVFIGRFNIGAISLHLPMILAKARKENKDFYEVLDYYLEMIRGIHIRTYKYLGELKASTNPLGFCEGGFLGGHLNPDDKIAPLLKPMTASFGITALNELQELYNGKSIAEDGEFCLDVMKHINSKVNEFKQEDGNLYAIYSTPAESLCGLQIEQFRNKYGVIKNVSDRPYVSNSFHCHVTENITPIQKQDLEGRFWNLSNGGKIQYCRYPISYNKAAARTLIHRAMDKGFYEGVNLSLAYCDDCGHEELEMDVCPVCGSRNLTKIDRMNGYLSYSRVKGHTRLNDAKMAEIAERKSM